MRIRTAEQGDLAALLDIYNYTLLKHFTIIPRAQKRKRPIGYLLFKPWLAGIIRRLVATSRFHRLGLHIVQTLYHNLFSWKSLTV